MNYSPQQRYKILKLIGSGGMADVFLAKDKILNKLVAIKKIKFSRTKNISGQANDTFDQKLLIKIKRIEREVNALSLVNHESLVKLHDYFIDNNGHDNIVMEYVPGVTLIEKIKINGIYELKEGLTIFLKILSAVKYLHSKGIIHRDLKPQNIIISPNGSFKITDFGIVIFKNQEHVTKTDNLIGSPFYLAPEIIFGLNKEKISPKVDIYSLGIILYELFIGSPPFPKNVNIFKIIQNQLTCTIPSVSNINKNIPSSIDKIVEKATSKNPKKRYKDIDEMIKDIEAVLLNKPLYIKIKKNNIYTKKWKKMFTKNNKIIIRYYYFIVLLSFLLICIITIIIILEL